MDNLLRPNILTCDKEHTSDTIRKMSKSPYPSVYQIEEMFQWRASADTFDKFDAIIDDHVQATMMGHDHHTAGEFQGKAAWKEGARARFTNMLDYSKPMKLDIVQVIGGGESPWACVEMKATGKAVNGKWRQKNPPPPRHSR